MATDIHPHRHQALQAILLAITGFGAYSVADLCSKILQEHYSIYQVLAVSSFSALVIVSLWLFGKHGVKGFVPKKIKLHAIRAFVILGAAYFFVRSLHTLPLADFYGISFLMPFLGMTLSALFLKEHVGWHRWLAAVLGFAGVLVLAGPQFQTIGEGVVCAALGALCGATNMILIRKIGHGEPLPLYGVYPFTAILLFNAAALWGTDSYVPFRMEDALYFLIHGPAIVLAITCTSLAFARAPETAVVAPFQYTQAIWGVLFGWIFFSALPDATTWTGLIMIIVAGLYMVWREHVRHITH